MGASRNVVYTVMTLTAGLLLDRFERVRIYAGFMVMGAVVVALFGVMNQVPLLIAWSSLLGFSSASFWVTASTLTADISPTENLSQSMGRYNLSWILGFVVGPYIGGVISDAYGYTVLFVFLAALILVSVGVILTRIRPTISLRNRAESRGLRLAPLRRLALGYLTLVPFTVILGIYMAIMPGYLKAVGLAAGLVGLLITLTNGVRGVGFFNTERFVAFGVRRSVALSSLLLVSSMLLFSNSTTLPGYVASLAMYGAAAGIMTPLMLDYLARRCDKSALGATMGMHEAVYGVGMCVGPLVGGAVADAYGPPVLYMGLAVVALTLLPLAVALGKTTMPKPGTPLDVG